MAGVLIYLIVAGLVVGVIGKRLGTDIFPSTDTGQFALRFRGPSGTQVAITEKVAKKILATIAREAGGDENVEVSIGLVGVYNSSFPVNLVHLWNGGPEEGWLAVQLKRDRSRKIGAFKERLREVLSKELPDVRLSFEPQDIVSRVMSFGSSTPIEVAVSGPSIASSKAHAEKLVESLRRIPFLRDVQIAQTLDFPTVGVDINRERAGLLGVKVDDVTRSLVAATTSSRFTVANFWADPATGISYNLQVQIPESRTQSLEDLGNVPVASDTGRTVLLRNVANITPGTAVGTYERYNMLRVVSVTANLHETDLGSAMAAVRKAVAEAGAPADARAKIDVRGQSVPLGQLVDGFTGGLGIAVVAIFLLLTANFQSARLALAVMSTVPAVLAGVCLALWLTGSTLNIQSAMGAIMAVGVAVANAILLVTFAQQALAKSGSAVGGGPVSAAVEGSSGRLRAITMTSSAMIAGMLPLALGLGDGGDQTAPLGRAVVGGLLAATVATLFVLPAIYVALAPKAAHSPSLDPDDPMASKAT